MEVTVHAMERFMERSGWARSDFEKAELKILSMLAQAVQVALTPQFRAGRLRAGTWWVNRFYRYNDWVFVLDLYHDKVVTVYTASPAKFMDIEDPEPLVIWCRL
jgi:hypothetical protein